MTDVTRVFVSAPPLAAPPRDATPVPTLPLRLVAARRRVFDPGSVTATGGPTPFVTMGRSLIEDLASEWPTVDLVVLAHTVPDPDPSVVPTCALVDASPRSPLAFAISGHDHLAPFVALRVAGAYLDSTRLRRALVLVLDRNTVPSTENDADPSASGVGVALVLDRAPAEAAATVLVQRHVPVNRLGATLRSHLPALIPHAEQVRFVAGHGVPVGQVSELGVPAVVASPGPRCTSIWAHLPAVVPGPAPVNRLVLVDYEPWSGCLSAASLEANGPW
jgi:hypothetical protein